MSDTRRKNSWRKEVRKWYKEYGGSYSDWYTRQFRADTDKFVERDGCGNGGRGAGSRRGGGKFNYLDPSSVKKPTVRYERRKNRKELEKKVDNEYT